MNFTPLYQTTLISEMPNIINGNFQAVSNYINVFYDEVNGVIISPINTPGRVKGSTGEFVTLTVDNLIVKSQYTNLYENITTANYDYWVAYTGVSSPLRDACTTLWENNSYKYIDVQKPYYKVIPFDSSAATGIYYAPKTNNKSQMVQFILDASGVVNGYYRFLVDPMPGATYPYLDITIDSSMLPEEQTKWITFFCVDYDTSYGATWAVYEYGNGAPGSGGGGGGGVTPAYVDGEIHAHTANFATNSSVNIALIPFATNVSVGLAFGPYATNASVNSAFASNSSLGNLSQWRLKDEASMGALTSRHNITETSLGVVTTNLEKLDASFYASYSNARIDASFATNASVNRAFLTNASLGLAFNRYANASLGLAFSQYANASLGLAFSQYANASLGLANNIVTNVSLGVVSQKMVVDNASIGQLTLLTNALNASTGTGLGAYATNTSVGLALQSYATIIYVDDSLNNLRAVPIKDSCLGGGLSWSGGTLYVDVSTIAGGVSLSYVDASLLARDAQIALRATNTSVGMAFASNSSLGSVSQLVFAINSSIGTGLGDYATNTSVGLAFSSNSSLGNISQLTYALNSSIGNYATNASVNLAFYSNASLGLANANYATNASVNTAIANFATNASVNLAFVTNVSLGNISQLTYALNTSIGSYATNVSVNRAFASNASLGNVSQLTYAHNASIAWLDASMKYAFAKNNAQDASISRIDSSLNDTINALSVFYTKSEIDASFSTSVSVTNLFLTNSSLGSLSQLTSALNSSTGSYATNASVNLAFRTNASLGSLSQLTSALNTSIGGYATNASVNLALTLYATNASSNLAFAQFIKSSSVGTTLYWNAGVLNVSTGFTYPTFAYVDGSLINHQNQINALANRVTTLEVSTGNATFAYVDGSLAARDASIISLFNKTSYIDACLGRVSILTYVQNTSIGWLDSSIKQIYPLVFKINSSIAWLDASIKQIYPLVFSINTSLGLYATNASVNSVLGSYALKVYVDGSLATRDGAISTLNSQVGTLNTNMSAVISRQNYTETSLYVLTGRHNVTESSLYRVNASLNDTIDAFGLFIPEVSLNDSKFKWVGGYLEPSASSAGGALSTLTDTSIVGVLNNDYLRYNSSIGKWVNETAIDASVVLRLSSLYDVSIKNVAANDYLRYDISWGKWVNEVTVEASTYYYTKTQVDASFALKSTLDACLNNATPISSYVNTSSYYDGSLNNIRSLIGSGGGTLASLTDVSIKSVANNNLLKYDSSFGKWMNITPVDACSYFYTKSQVDASFALIVNVNASLNDVFLISSYVNTSEYYDGSLNRINASLNSVIDLSSIVYTKTQIDASFATNASVNRAFLTNASLGLAGTGSGGLTRAQADASYALITSVNASLNDTIDAFGLFIPEVSLNDTYFKWTGGLLEPSVAGGGLTRSQIDASYALLTTVNAISSSINDFVDGYGIFIPEVSLNDTYFKWTSGLLEPSIVSAGGTLSTLSDVSIKSIANNDLLKYDSSFGKWMNVAPADACSYFYTKTQVDASFALKSAVNASFGAINASLNDVFLLSSYVNTSEYYDGSINSLRNNTGVKAFQTISITGSPSTATWNMTLGYNAKVTLTRNTSLNITNASSGDSGTLIVIQDASGSRLLDLPVGSYKNSAWILSDASNSRDIISFLYDGTNYYWNKGGPYA